MISWLRGHTGEILQRLRWISFGAIIMLGFLGAISVNVENSHISARAVTDAAFFLAIVFFVVNVCANSALTGSGASVGHEAMVAAIAAVAVLFALAWGFEGAMRLGPQGMVDPAFVLVWAATPMAVLTVSITLFIGTCLRLVFIAATSLLKRND